MSRAGRRAFEKCDVKVVQLKQFVYEEGEEGSTVLSTNPTEEARK